MRTETPPAPKTALVPALQAAYTGRMPAAGGGHAAMLELLAFQIGAEQYGIPILNVQEIRSFEAPTRIAGAPAAMLGVLDLRGAIVPVIDLRRCFGCEPRFDVSTVTIVLNVGARTVGAVADAVSDVIELAPDQMRRTPLLADAIGDPCINGIGSVRQADRESMLILLDLDRLLARAELGPAGARVCC